MMMALFSSSLLHANITYKANAAVVQQQAVCKGTVVDSNGEPVVGASVFAVSNGHKKGSVTDLDGNFEIDGIASGSSLTISYVGYKTQQVTWSGKDLKVTLQESSEMLDNVVVVGYGTQKKVNLTGAVSVVSSKTLDSRPVTSVAQALQGEVPGLNFSVGNGGGSLIQPRVVRKVVRTFLIMVTYVSLQQLRFLRCLTHMTSHAIGMMLQQTVAVMRHLVRIC